MPSVLVVPRDQPNLLSHVGMGDPVENTKDIASSANETPTPSGERLVGQQSDDAQYKNLSKKSPSFVLIG